MGKEERRQDYQCSEKWREAVHYCHNHNPSAGCSPYLGIVQIRQSATAQFVKIAFPFSAPSVRYALNKPNTPIATHVASPVLATIFGSCTPAI